MTDFIFLGSKITVDADYSHEIKTPAPWKESYDKHIQHIKKQSHLLTKVHIVKVMVFPVVMYGCESWTRKKAECKRIDAFELWCWRRLLSPLSGKVIKPVIPKGYQPGLFIGRTDAEVKAPIV